MDLIKCACFYIVYEAERCSQNCTSIHFLHVFTYIGFTHSTFTACIVCLQSSRSTQDLTVSEIMHGSKKKPQIMMKSSPSCCSKRRRVTTNLTTSKRINSSSSSIKQQRSIQQTPFCKGHELHKKPLGQKILASSGLT